MRLRTRVSTSIVVIEKEGCNDDKKKKKKIAAALARKIRGWAFDASESQGQFSIFPRVLFPSLTPHVTARGRHFIFKYFEEV